MGKINKLDSLASKICAGLGLGNGTLVEWDNKNDDTIWMSVAYDVACAIGTASISVSTNDLPGMPVCVWLWLDDKKIYGQTFNSLTALQKANLDNLGLQFGTMLTRGINARIKKWDGRINRWQNADRAAA